jgi:hypothetical protein
MGVLRTSVLCTFVVLVVGGLLAAMVAVVSFLQFDAVSISIKPSSSTLLLARLLHGHAGSMVLLPSYSSQGASTVSNIVNNSGAIGVASH